METGILIFLIIVVIVFIWFLVEVKRQAKKLGKKKLKGMNVMGVNFK
jgi:L-cystine uptake protein TcyP (sodium:dicarboxylate symporter family)